jgi:hypothetical protein
LGAGGPLTGAPELFLLRSLLLSDDSIGWPLAFVPVDWPPCEYERDGWLGDCCTVGLNVTVRCGFGGFCCGVAFDIDEIRGVVSVLLDAIVTDPFLLSLPSLVL